jgi:hypothetical protein
LHFFSATLSLSFLDPILRSWVTTVKIYNATSSLVRFESKNILFYSEKNALVYIR